MIDSTEHQRRARDAFMAARELPRMPPAVRDGVEAMGVRCGPDGGATVEAELPRGWSKAAHPVDPHVFWVLDERGRRRLRVTWAAAPLFSREPSRGSVCVLEPDGLAYSFHEDVARRLHVVRLACLRGRREVTGSLMPFEGGRVASITWFQVDQEASRHQERCCNVRLVAYPWKQTAGVAPVLDAAPAAWKIEAGVSEYASRDAPLEVGAWPFVKHYEAVVVLTAYEVECAGGVVALVYAASAPDAAMRAAVDAAVSMTSRQPGSVGSHDDDGDRLAAVFGREVDLLERLRERDRDVAGRREAAKARRAA